MEGLLNIDKPAGLTSHDVVARIRRVAQTRRVGHSGTLDPAATGVLLVCVGRATRLVEYLVGQEKGYIGRITLGQTTSTYDAEGEVILERPVPHLTPVDLESALAPFRGDILQIPPMVSAIKKDGQPLYKLAREGKVVDRPPRPVTIYRLRVLAFESPHIDIEVVCSSGTYIRSIAYDVGEGLGCGGHLSRLRRTHVGPHSLDQATPLDELTPERLVEVLQPADTAVAHLPQLNLSEDETAELTFGRMIERRSDGPQAPLARAYTPSNRFLGIVTQREKMWKPKKMFL